MPTKQGVAILIRVSKRRSLMGDESEEIRWGRLWSHSNNLIRGVLLEGHAPSKELWMHLSDTFDNVPDMYDKYWEVWWSPTATTLSLAQTLKPKFITSKLLTPKQGKKLLLQSAQLMDPNSKKKAIQLWGYNKSRLLTDWIKSKIS